MRLAAGTTLGPYRVVSLLGSGGMGEVYRAQDPRLGRDVAIKVLPEAGDSDRLRRFESEARAASALQHPGILTVFDVGSQGGMPYVVSELLEGMTLRQRLGEGALPRDMAINYAGQVADALAAAHEGGVVHRDLKPENLFITRAGRVKILDFGLAKIRGARTDEQAPDTPTVSQTAPGVVMGTAGYMSPEQVRGMASDARSDIFSFGAVLYEMLTGRRAFRGQTAVETMAAILREEPPALSGATAGVPDGLTQIVSRCLRKDPGDRFATGRELTAALTAAPKAGMMEPTAPVLPPTAPSAPRLGTAWRKPRVGATILSVMLIGAALYYRALRPRASSTPPSPVVASAEPTASEVVTLSRLGASPKTLDELQERLGTRTGAPQIALRLLDGKRIDVSGPHSQVRNAASALRIQDALVGYRFPEHPSLFRTGADSSRPISFDFSGLPQARFLRIVAAAAHWPVVVDPSVQGSLTFALTEVPWDVAVRTVLDVCQLRASRFGDVWIVSSKERAGEIERRELPQAYRRRPRRTTASAMAAALEAARGENGVVAANPRLNAVVIADRADAFPAYARIFAAVDREVGPLEFPRRNPYTGLTIPHKLSLDFQDGDLQDIFRLFADISGLNVVVEPGIAGKVTLIIEDVPWDNALDVILRSHGLGYQIDENLLRISRESKGGSEIAVETVTLRQEDPEFFKPFARCLTPAGALHIETQSRTLIIRDVRERATWFRQFAEDIDREGR